MRKFFFFLSISGAVFSFGWIYSDQSNMVIAGGGAGSINVSGGGTGNVQIVNSGITHYPDITFYDKMDSSATGRAPTKGSGTLSITSNISEAAPLSSSSTASLYCNTLGFKHVNVSTANINYSVGRAGFYFVWDSATANASTAIGVLPSGDATPRFTFRKGNSGNTWSFKYDDVSIDNSLTSGVTYYVQLEWDQSKAHGYCAGVQINAGSMSTSNSCTGGPPSYSIANFGLLGDGKLDSGTSMQGRMDEVIISSDSQRDLYAIRDLGSYPN